jgi:Mn2+/Fe2+ NRAMP family transporter
MRLGGRCKGFLELHISPWKRVLLTRTVAMVPTVLVAVFTGIPHALVPLCLATVTEED